MATTYDRWSAKVVRTDECWIWTGAKTRAGYGVLHDRGRQTTAHRIAFELASGMIVPARLDVCHHCDNTSCVKPTHLFLGTRSENHRDAVAKGRWMTEARRNALRRTVALAAKANRHRRNSQAQLTNDEVIWIMSLKGLARAGKLALEMDIDRHMIANIWAGRSWAWLFQPSRSNRDCN